MENIVIPGWATALLLPALGAMVYGLIYATRMTLDNKEKIAVLISNEIASKEWRDQIQNTLVEVKTDMSSRTDKIETKLDNVIQMIAFKK